MPVLTDLFRNVIVPLLPKLADMASTWMDKAVPAVEQFAGWIMTLKPDFVTAFKIISTLKPYLIDIGVAWAVWNVALAVTRAIGMATFLAQLVTQSYIAASATKGMTLAQWALNLALDANPIGLVIVAVAALAAAGIYLYTHWKPFRDFVNGLWDDLKRFGSWIQNTLWPWLQKLGDALGGVGGAIGGIGNAAHNAHIPGFATGGVVPGPIGAPMLAIVHGGERVLTPTQQRARGDYSPEIVARLDRLIAVVTAQPGGQTGVEAALYKAVQLSGVNRARGMAGA